MTDQPKPEPGPLPLPNQDAHVIAWKVASMRGRRRLTPMQTILLLAACGSLHELNPRRHNRNDGQCHTNCPHCEGADD